MNDNEIIEALKHWVKAYNKGCIIAANALDLINRQKAEIERLKAENEGYKHLDIILHTAIDKLTANIKSEAIREFAEEFDDLLWNMKIEYNKSSHIDYGLVCEVIHHKLMKLVKEMTEGENG